jgi:hypothetical protein
MLPPLHAEQYLVEGTRWHPFSGEGMTLALQKLTMRGHASTPQPCKPMHSSSTSNQTMKSKGKLSGKLFCKIVYAAYSMLLNEAK